MMKKTEGFVVLNYALNDMVECICYVYNIPRMFYEARKCYIYCRKYHEIDIIVNNKEEVYEDTSRFCNKFK